MEHQGYCGGLSKVILEGFTGLVEGHPMLSQRF